MTWANAIEAQGRTQRPDTTHKCAPGGQLTIAGLIKNALDYTQDMMKDDRPYFAGRPVGCIATGAGWQGVVGTLEHLRALRTLPVQGAIVGRALYEGAFTIEEAVATMEGTIAN